MSKRTSVVDQEVEEDIETEQYKSQNTIELEEAVEQKESKLNFINTFQQNFQFSLRIRSFREQIHAFVTQLCKKECNRDYDALA